jgi:hypothetical protein
MRPAEPSPKSTGSARDGGVTVVKSGFIYWLQLERSKAQQLLNLYQLGIDRVSLSRLGREPEDITEAEIERLKKTIADFNSFLARDTG